MTQLSELFPHLKSQAYLGEPGKWDDLFGVELELENVSNFNTNVSSGDIEDWEDEDREPSDNTIDGWSPHSDASLRNGIEFVTTPAMGGAELQRAIDSFYSYGIMCTAGPRTSTHIHVNMMQDTSGVLASMVALVYAIEEGIYCNAEVGRKWGGYSVPLSEMSPARLRGVLNPSSNHTLASSISANVNQERYYGFNFNLSRHGTVEFRYFPGGPTKDELESWIDLVSFIKKAAASTSLEVMLHTLTTEELFEGFLRDKLGYWADKLLSVRGSEFYFNKLQEVLTLACDERNPELPSSLVYAHEALVSFVSKQVLKGDEDAIDYLLRSIPSNKILSQEDWRYFVARALEISSTKESSIQRYISTVPLVIPGEL